MASLPGLRREGSAVTVDYRVLATVSRTWADFGQAAIALGLVRSIALGYGLRPTLVHGDNPHGEYTQVEPSIRGLPLEEIPFVFFGASGNASDCEKPPLLDDTLAELAKDREHLKARL